MVLFPKEVGLHPILLFQTDGDSLQGIENILRVDLLNGPHGESSPCAFSGKFVGKPSKIGTSTVKHGDSTMKDWDSTMKDRDLAVKHVHMCEHVSVYICV